MGRARQSAAVKRPHAPIARSQRAAGQAVGQEAALCGVGRRRPQVYSMSDAARPPPSPIPLKYARLARAFAAGFAATSYREDIGFFAKLRLVLFWPALWLTDARGFRSEFARALRAAEGGDASKTKNPPEPPPPRIEGGDETR